MYDVENRALKDMAQSSLDRTGEALMTRDFDLFARFYDVPYTIATESGIAYRATRDELRAGFEDAADHYRDSGVTRMDREVEFLVGEQNSLRFSYLTRLMAGDRLIRAAYPNIATMKKRDGVWKTVATEHIVSDSDAFTGALLRVDHDNRGDRDSAVAEFQDVLDRVTRAYLTNQFDLLADAVSLPLFMQGSRARQAFATRAELEADFRHYQREFELHQITDIVRLVKSAVRAGSGRMHGTYRTHILCGTQLFLPAYTSAMTLVRDDAHGWQIATIMHPIGHWTHNSRQDAPEEKK